MRRLSFLFLVLALAGVPTFAGTIDDLTWMSGSWRSESEGSSSEELWTKPAGGLMLGLHRDVRSNGRAFFEFLRIEERDGAITYIAQPGGKAPTPFPLKLIEGSKATFENPDHDFPQRIIYWIDEGKLCARAESIAEPGKGPQWCWAKVDE